ncbi:pyrimidine-specific ribonucleoside hydrolase RihA [soil metagenome]
MSLPRIPLILDCDPGHDDALAILLALARPELELLGITTVAGNATLAATTRNALSILALAGRPDIPVAAGADRPLVRPLTTADYVHGDSGLEGTTELPEPEAEPRPEGAVALTLNLLEAASTPVTLVATGPLTNVARLLDPDPTVNERLAGIHIMGGAIGLGNRTASAEFNIWVDPEAAARVFESGLPVTMIGIDVSHQAVVPLARSDAWGRLGTRTGRIFADLFRYFAIFHRERYGWDGSPIHDAITVAQLVEADLVESQPCRVDVEFTSELTRGRTVVDVEGLTRLPSNARVGTSIDAPRFMDLVDEVIARYP